MISIDTASVKLRFLPEYFLNVLIDLSRILASTKTILILGDRITSEISIATDMFFVLLMARVRASS
ncbi:MAG: hypothetical protein OIN83_03005 [Candidatus Methanoperedens sp.]|nr:hypothetical protein [Candidatus Methanoperedens sp.]